jgi:hypothetical protein
MKFIKNKFVSSILIISTILITSGIFPKTLIAASFTSASDVMSTQQTGLTSDHTLTWTLGTGHMNTAADTIAIDFVVADYVPSGTWQTTDFLFTGNAGGATAAAEVGTGAAVCTGHNGATDYIVNVNAGTDTFTLTLCGTWTQSAPTFANTLVIKGATGGTGVLTNNAANVESSLITITDTGDDTDSTTLAAVVEDLDVVTVTATVNPTLLLEISSATVALGVITASTTGKGSHTAQVATNATGGFLLTYNGATLTAPQGTIVAYGAQASSVAGTEGFGINMKDNATPDIGAEVTQNKGSCSAPATNYATADKFSYVASTTTPLTAQTTPADCTYTVSYVANISTVTPAGSYSTPITYIASGTF